MKKENNHRKGTQLARKKQITEESAARKKEWDKLDLYEKRKYLDLRYGIGQGALKQRTRLNKEIEALENKNAK